MIDDDIGQGLRLSKSFEDLLENMIKERGMSGFVRAGHMIDNFEKQGYDVKAIKQIYDTYALEYHKKKLDGGI